MSNTYRAIYPSALDPEHWERHGIKSMKHLARDRTDPWHKTPYRWNSYGGRGRIYRHKQFLDKEFKEELYSTSFLSKED